MNKFSFVLLMIFLYDIILASKSNIHERLKELKKRLEIINIPCPEDVFPFSNKQEISKAKELAREGIVNKGALSEEAIQRILFKALQGEQVLLYILGESVSVGADLGKNNKETVFHNTIANWWESIFTDVTGSKMVRQNVAIGGVGTTYFGRCWEEYLSPNDKFDLAIWEFNINDGTSDTDDLRSTLELFMNKFYKRYGRLDLLISVFYHRSIFGKRHDFQEEIHAELAQKYNLTCFNIEPLLNQSNGELGKEELVSKNHPSRLAHLQMSFLIIDYYKEVMLRALDSWIESKNDPILPDSNYTLPSSYKSGLNTDLIQYKAVCWTAVTPDFRRNQLYNHSLFELQGNVSEDFKNITKGWDGVEEERYDLTGGYQTTTKGAVLELKFNTTDERDSFNVSVALRSWVPFSVISVKLERENIKFVKTNASLSTSDKDKFSTIIGNKDRGDGLLVYSIAIISSGEWTLTMKLINGDLLLCAIMIL